MSKINNQIRKEKLALALADGGTVSDWAAANDVKPRTAYAWSTSREVVDQVNAIRRAALEQAVNRFSKKATVASDEMVRLITEAASESVRLQAARAVLTELMAVCNHAALEHGWTRSRGGWPMPGQPAWNAARCVLRPASGRRPGGRRCRHGRAAPLARCAPRPDRPAARRAAQSIPPAQPAPAGRENLQPGASSADSGARADRARGLGPAPTFVPQLPGHPPSCTRRNRPDSGYDEFTQRATSDRRPAGRGESRPGRSAPMVKSRSSTWLSQEPRSVSGDLSGFSLMELFRMEAEGQTATLSAGLVASRAARPHPRRSSP